MSAKIVTSSEQTSIKFSLEPVLNSEEQVWGLIWTQKLLKGICCKPSSSLNWLELLQLLVQTALFFWRFLILTWDRKLPCENWFWIAQSLICALNKNLNISIAYRIFQVTTPMWTALFTAVDVLGPAVMCCICIVIHFQFFHMIFNTSQRAIK